MEAFGVNNYFTYLIGVIMIILLPGPNSLYVLATATQYGMRSGWLAACGVFVGDLILMLLTAMGVATVLQAYPALFYAVKYAGAAYLGYIGLRLMNHAVKNWSEKPAEQVLEESLNQKVSRRTPFQKALVISLLNPKAILFLLSFFVQFVEPGFSPPLIPFMILGITMQLCSFVYLAGLIFLGAQIARNFNKRKRLVAATSASTGAIFIGFAAKLALVSL